MFFCFLWILFSMFSYFTPHFTTAHSFTVLQKHFSDIHNLSACSVILQSISVHYIICVWHEETRTRTPTRIYLSRNPLMASTFTVNLQWVWRPVHISSHFHDNNKHFHSVFFFFFFTQNSLTIKRQKTPTVANQKPKPNRTKRSRKINNLKIN